MNATNDTFVFAGGGTGGHIFPALAIAERLRELAPDARCIFLCSPRPIDSRILRENGEEFRVIPAEPFGFRPARLLRFARGWRRATRAAEGVLRECARTGSTRVVAMGGFVAAPVVRAARSVGVPVVLVNLDASPGKANRMVARWSDRVFDAASTGTWPQAQAVRPVVRRGAVASGSRQECRRALGLSPELPLLFVTGGSQGAKTLNDLMTLIAREPGSPLRGWQVFHQTGPDADSEMQKVYDDAGIPARAVVSCREMSQAWGAADLAISRGGAGAVAEVWANAVPAVFLPYPFHRDEHQRLNAQPLETAGCAVIIKDWVDAPRTWEALREPLTRLMSQADLREGFRAALRGLGPADGAETIARALVSAPRR